MPGTSSIPSSAADGGTCISAGRVGPTTATCSVAEPTSSRACSDSPGGGGRVRSSSSPLMARAWNYPRRTPGLTSGGATGSQTPNWPPLRVLSSGKSCHCCTTARRSRAAAAEVVARQRHLRLVAPGKLNRTEPGARPHHHTQRLGTIRRKDSPGTGEYSASTTGNMRRVVP